MNCSKLSRRAVYCVRPKLKVVPAGDWFCAKCTRARAPEAAGYVRSEDDDGPAGKRRLILHTPKVIAAVAPSRRRVVSSRHIIIVVVVVIIISIIIPSHLISSSHPLSSHLTSPHHIINIIPLSSRPTPGLYRV